MSRSSLVAVVFLVLGVSPPVGAQTNAGDCPPEKSTLKKLVEELRDAFHKAPCHANSSRALPDEVDTLVIGAGPGGGTVAGKLANGGQTVALLDAGNMSQVLPISESLAAFAASAETRSQELAYGVERIPESGYLANYPRLAGMGGSAVGAAGIMAPFTWSAMDALARQMKDPSLSADRMKGYQKEIEGAHWDLKGRAEDFFLRGLSPSIHGHRGFQQTGLPGASTILSTLPDAGQLGSFYGALLKSQLDPKNAGAILTRVMTAGDLTDPDVQKSEGLVLLPAATKKDGTRSTVAQYIEDTQCAHPDKLFLKGNAVVDKILWEKGADGKMRAVGVEYLEGGHLLQASPAHDANAPAPVRRTIRAKNVVVANSPFGAVGTLERSGVGPAEDLKRLGVATVVDRPGVGKRVGDRLETTLVLKFPHEFKVLGDLENAETKLKALSDRLDQNPNDEGAKKDVKALFEQYKGILTTNGIPLAMLWKSDPSLKEPDLLFIGFPGNFTNFKKGFSDDFTEKKNMLSIIMLKVDTASDGSAKVTTTDPTVQPKISIGYDPKGPDMAAMAKGVLRFNQEIASRIPGVEVVRGKAASEAEALTFLSNDQNIFGHHIRGGAAMGPADDPLAVVDSNQKVYGTENVYVAGTAAWNGSMGPFPIVPIEAMSARLGDKILEANAAGNARKARP